MTLPILLDEPNDTEPPEPPPHLVEVAFKGNRRAFLRCDFDVPPPVGSAVIVAVDRGEDLARVHATGARARSRNAGVPHGVGAAMPEERIVRMATAGEIARERQLRAEDEGARRTAVEKVKAAKLDLKISDAEWQLDRKKLTFYFTAEQRIDFRALVRDLAALFRTRIELKQYGVRDEAKRLSGVGRCGREYCSAAWLPELRPVNLGVAKEQRLSLNPSQISGACGRLMCCLRYEHDFYVAARKRFPKEGKIVVLDRGEEKVMALDIFRDRVTLRNPEGEQRVVELAEFLAATAAPASPAAPAATAGSASVELPAPAAASAPAPRVPTAPVEPAVAQASTSETDTDTDDSPDDAASPDAPTTTGESGGATRRRRRGRRGGRRGRGAPPGGAPNDGAPPSTSP